MLQQRTFRIVLVRTDHGAGIESTEQADAVVRYSGKETIIPLH